jgi:putative endonuclease
MMAYYAYLLASKKHSTLYLGVTNDLVRRVYEHRTKVSGGFTARYDVDKLVWFEIYDDAITAIAREKELKKWRRDWKIRLIEEQNPSGLISIPGYPTNACGYGFRARRFASPRNDELIERNDLPHRHRAAPELQLAAGVDFVIIAEGELAVVADAEGRDVGGPSILTVSKARLAR